VTEVVSIALVVLLTSMTGTFVARCFKSAALAYSLAALASVLVLVSLLMVADALAVRGVLTHGGLPDNYIRGN
jgi:hypothetical protein